MHEFLQSFSGIAMYLVGTVFTFVGIIYIWNHFTRSELPPCLPQMEDGDPMGKGGVRYALVDQDDEVPEGEEHQWGTVRMEGGRLMIYIDGYGEKTAVDGAGCPCFLEMVNGRIKVHLAPDINREEFPGISLAKAKESLRIDDE